MIEIMSVTKFIAAINEIVAGQFIIEGEVSQYKISQGKWIFFDLKDDASVLNCFATVFNMRQPLEDGMKVRVTGYPNVRAQNGKFSLTVQFVEIVGEGSLRRAYLLLKEKLQKEGLFGVERKRQLPRFPSQIGVIASGDSAAFGDFKRIVNNRWGGVEILLRHVQVQGAPAAGDIVRAFKEFNESPELPAVIVLVRGGGSMEDLAAFNAEEVVRAVSTSRVPVVTGVGHERDETLVDFVADVRASTPSNAAEIVVPERREFFGELEFDLERLLETLGRGLTARRNNLDRALSLMLGKIESPLFKIRQTVQEFNGSAANLFNGVEKKKAFVASAERLFKNVDPKRVLSRGYSITRNSQGNIVKAVKQVDAGETIVVELAEGKIEAEVNKGGKKVKQISLFSTSRN